jgi:radical SAM protein with 4Fe4S-binding SPASM domain
LTIEHGLFAPSKIPELLGLVSIVVSPTDLCNRTCSFCPHSREFPNKKNYMHITLANKLAEELLLLKWDGVISISGYGEPLLHPNIDNIIKAFTSRGINTRLVTSGDRILNGKFTPEQIDNWDLLSIKIDCYDGQDDVVKMNNILKNLKTPKRISTGPDEISNRGGYLWKAKRYNKPCYQPSMKSIMDWNGNVYVCCEDWNKEVSFGNIYEQTFSSIWLSEKLHNVRKNLQKGMRTFSACKSCNFLPENSQNEREAFEIWQNYKYI